MISFCMALIDSLNNCETYNNNKSDSYIFGSKYRVNFHLLKNIFVKLSPVM